MHWPYERSEYQVTDVDGRAVLYEVHTDGVTLRWQSFDLTADELGQSLRMGGFRLIDVAATPGAPTPFIGDFRVINGNRQMVGLALAATTLGTGSNNRMMDERSISDRALDGALRGGFPQQVAVSDESERPAPARSTRR